MIPRVDPALLKGIRNEVRRAAGTKLSLRQRFSIRLGLGPSATRLDSVVHFFALIVLAFFLVGLFCIGVVAGLEGWRNWNPEALDHSSAISAVAFLGCSATGLAFICFAGRPSERLHRICLLYPHRDRTIGRFVLQRTILAAVVLMVVSFYHFAVVTEKFQLSEFGATGALAFVLLQTSIQLAFVLLFAKQWKPNVASCHLWLFGGAAMLVGLTMFSLPLFCEESTLVWHGAIWMRDFSRLYLSPQTWVANLWFLSDRFGTFGMAVLGALVTWCLFEGVRSFHALRTTRTTKFLDGDFVGSKDQEQLAFNGFIAMNAEGQKPSTAESVLAQVDHLQQSRNASEGPVALLICLFRSIAVAFKPKGPTTKWRRCFRFALSAIGFTVPVILMTLWIAICFNSSTSFECQLIAKITSTWILMIPLSRTIMSYSQLNFDALYPISNSTMRRIAAKRALNVLPLVVPVFVVLNIVFCCFYDISAVSKLHLVGEPVVSALAVCGLAFMSIGNISDLNSTKRKLLSLVYIVSCSLVVSGILIVVLPTGVFIREISPLFESQTYETLLIANRLKSLVMLVITAAMVFAWITFKDHVRLDVAEPRNLFDPNSNMGRQVISPWESQ